jgi:2-keto-4-pentenoate hydratase/2-oxohepta-3-ene-1,7-dioic acid hydratase in catechol pathway
VAIPASGVELRRAAAAPQSTISAFRTPLGFHSRTSQLIWSLPGDLISTGTPSGTGGERNEFFKRGDAVEIEIDGTGILDNTMDTRRSQ